MKITVYGEGPLSIAPFLDLDLPEVMYYLYLPVFMGDDWEPTTRFEREQPLFGPRLRLPKSVECCLPLILAAMKSSPKAYRYIYLSARKGWATPDNPLNRPGWHCDGFGTDDMNYVWWRGPGTRFLWGNYTGISEDHVKSLSQFADMAMSWPDAVMTPPEAHLYAITPRVIHATPLLERGCMRQYVKISMSDHRYNLKDNSHNYLFDYEWKMHDRAEVRNDTDKAQRDYL